MCVISMVGDEYGRTFPERWPNLVPVVTPLAPSPGVPELFRSLDLSKYATKEDVEKLRKEVEALREALVAAGKLDEAMGAKECVAEEKVALIRRLAEIVGVDLSAALKPLEPRVGATP